MIKFADMKENRLYLIIWGAALAFFALRIVVECIYHGEGAIDFAAILESWLRLVPFILLFAVHNYLVAPLFVEKKQTALYVVLTLLLLAAFIAWIVLWEERPEHSLMPPVPEPWDPDMDLGQMQPRMGSRPMHPASLKALMGILMVGGNLGIKIYFRDEFQKQELQRLERENLKYQLEYLRYQINPHFFMNTLNNIHALVDFDPEKAKESIVELSKLMRHVLYDSDKPTIPLSQELDYLANYVSLMRLRYPEHVNIEFSAPAQADDAEVPPLSFASFVENAFKHGLNGGKDSFIRIGVALENGKIIFKCINSRPSAPATAGGGVGMKNARQRFDLLYGDAYTLHIDESADVYAVVLVLPCKPVKI